MCTVTQILASAQFVHTVQVQSFFFFCTNYFATRWQHRPRPVSQSEKKRGRQNKNKNHENKLLKTSKTIFTHINQHLCEGIKRYFQLKRRYWTRINVSNITACCHFVCEFTNLRVKKMKYTYKTYTVVSQMVSRLLC